MNKLVICAVMIMVVLFASGAMAQQIQIPNTGRPSVATKTGILPGAKTGTHGVKRGTQIGTQTLGANQIQQQNLPGVTKQGILSPQPGTLTSAFSHALFGEPTIRNQAVTPPREPFGLPFSNIVGPRQSNTGSTAQRNNTFLNVPVGSENR